MPQERENQYPNMTQAVWDEVRQGVPRHVAAARLVVSRKIAGIPHRPYLLGDSDHAPVVQGVAEFASKVYALLDALEDVDPHSPVAEAAGDVAAAMEEFKL